MLLFLCYVAFIVSCPEKDACKRCCFDEKGLCAPVMVNGAPQFLDDGIPCVFGICNSNVSVVCLQSECHLFAKESVICVQK